MSVKHDKVGSLKVKNCPVSDAEWQNILEKLFDQKPQPEIHATASVSEGSLALVVRKSVEGITVSSSSIIARSWLTSLATPRNYHDTWNGDPAQFFGVGWHGCRCRC